MVAAAALIPPTTRAIAAPTIPLLGTATAPRPTPDAASAGRLDRTIRFLQDAQQPDGGFGGSPGAPSDPLFSAWVALGLAAGGVNPQDQRRPGGTDVFSYLRAHADELETTTDHERALLVVVAAGADPHDFGGIDLVARITDRQLPDGSFAHALGGKVGGINDTTFAVIALSGVGDRALRPVIRRSAQWLRANQRDDGGWGWGLTTETSADITASVIEALRAAGVDDSPQERTGWNYLRSASLPADGGFVYSPPEAESNTASTAWAVQGMWAAGLEPRRWVTRGPGPLDFLTAMQEAGSGMIRWKASTLNDPRYSDNPIWMTAYAAPAFAGYPLPIPAVARSRSSADAGTADGGVTAGGGGNGAPNFSRPEPQSSGSTTGGVRRIRSEEDEPDGRDRSGTRAARTPSEQERETAGSNGRGDAGITRDRADRAEQRTAGATSGDRADGTTTGSAAPAISGAVLSAPRAGASGTGDLDAAAPGLRAATPERIGTIAATIAGLMLLGLIAGMHFERQRTVSP